MVVIEEPKYDLLIAAVGGDEESIKHNKLMIFKESCSKKAVRKRFVCGFAENNFAL